MKYLVLAGLLLAGCTGIAEHRAQTVASDNDKCRALHGGETVTHGYLECLDRLALERTKKRQAEEARRAAENTWRAPAPVLSPISPP